MKTLKLQGLNITKEQFEEKYQVSLSEEQWNFIVSETQKLWVDHADELRLLAFKHIRSSMSNLGFKTQLEGKEIVFKEK